MFAVIKKDDKLYYSNVLGVYEGERWMDDVIIAFSPDYKNLEFINLCNKVKEKIGYSIIKNALILDYNSKGFVKYKGYSCINSNFIKSMIDNYDLNKFVNIEANDEIKKYAILDNIEEWKEVKNFDDANNLQYVTNDFHDATIEFAEIESGKKKELSCGYDCDITDEINPTQRNIRGNHVALCSKGRAGIAKIVDSLINDMALSRSDAMDRCISLGKRFIEHFDKIYKNSTNISVNHWINEMSSWYKSVKEIKLKNTNDYILDGDLRDWFFTAGANASDFMSSPSYQEIKDYDIFTKNVLNTNNIKSSIKNIIEIKD